MKPPSFSSERLWFVLSVLFLWVFPFAHAQPLVHSAILIFVFLLNSFSLGNRWFSSFSRWTHPFLGGLMLVASSSIIQTIWYYAAPSLGVMSDGWSLGFSILVLCLLPVPISTQQTEEEHTEAETFFSYATRIPPLLIAAEIGLGFILLQAWRAQTTEAINTPWSLLPAGTVAAFVLIAACIWLSAWRKMNSRLTGVLACTLLLSVTLTISLIYTLGFGFDGFLHRASEQVLLNTGTLTPKPPYYIGQYVFVTWMSRIFDAPLFSIDRYLVPLSALLIPLVCLLRVSKKTSSSSLVGLALFLPFSFLITSTPQSFSYVIGLSALILAISTFEKRIPWLLPFLLGFWSLVIHPLSGLPFFGAVLLILWIAYKEWAPRLVRSLIWLILLIGTSISTPLAFFLNGLISQNAVAWNLHALSQEAFYAEFFQQLLRIPALHFALLVDWTDFWKFLAPGFAFALAVWATVRDKERRSVWLNLTLLAIGMCLSGVFLRASGEFGFLIDYERGNYADRLFILAGLLLLPATLQGFSQWIERLRKSSPGVGLAAFTLFLAASGAHVYDAFPRHDAAIVGHGWSVGQADIDVVRFIDKDAHGRVYTVLANQSVSAAAISQYGFKRYAGGDVFYYPIPTGGPLYGLFLDAMSKPDRGVIREASELGKSDLVYVVINGYWNNAERLAEQYKTLSDKGWTAYNNKIYLFRFDFSTSSKPIK